MAQLATFQIRVKEVEVLPLEELEVLKNSVSPSGVRDF